MQVLGAPTKEPSKSTVAETRSKAKVKMIWNRFLDQLEVNRNRIFILEHYLPPGRKNLEALPETFPFQKTTCS